MSLNGNICLEYFKESGNLDKRINKLHSSLNVSIQQQQQLSSSSSSSSPLILNLTICCNNTNERITGQLDNSTHIIATFKHQGKLTIRLIKKRLNILISNADEKEIDSVVKTILQKHNDNYTNYNKENTKKENDNPNQDEAIKKFTTIFHALQNKIHASHNNTKNQMTKKIDKTSLPSYSSSLSSSSSPPMIGKKKAFQKSPTAKSPPNNKTASTLVMNKNTPIKTPAKKKLRFGLTPTKQSIQDTKKDQSNTVSHKKLTKEQKDILTACNNGESVFFTGKAGTGKSFLLNHIVSSLQTKHGVNAVHVTALTGLAALAIGGVTIHQYAGIGAMYENGDSIEATVRKALTNTYTVKRLRDTKILLIDEISMMSNCMIDLLNLLAQQARGNKKPMGGIQVILTGDFFQLPPILKNNTGSFQLKASQPEFLSQSQQNIPELSQSQSQLPTKDTPDRFCFQSTIWNSIIKKSFVLKKVFRQSNNKFICMLDHIREGNLTDDVLESFNECVGREFDADDQILPTQILTHRYDVDKLNEEQLHKLEGELQEYKASDTGDNIYMKMLQNHCPAKSLLKLKIGAQVILVKTIGASDGLMNGSRGIIVKFTNDKKPVVKFCDGNERVINYSSFHFVQGGKVVAQRSQIPLDLAWGISVHKSQGMTVDRAMVNLKKVFEYGQAYVALSRVRSLEGLHLVSRLTANQIKVHPAVINFYRSIEIEKEKSLDH